MLQIHSIKKPLMSFLKILEEGMEIERKSGL